MYLKSLEIQGFKSFPDKIKLDFNKGITAVVGPNGSGKSNIGDAVRWVLGEQSSKTLRGARMEDVIFAGTQSRKPMGFAQVTLEIDNSDHILNVDSDEAAVTRKLYRSGESEYLINGKNCRLKDVTELFMDTGMGRDGYSIIGQGRIAEIVSAKSNERRDIFEEAAGISKFRFKKAEAERKLLNAEENLLRLKDIVSALEVRIEPLKKQSEKAAEFISLSEEKKFLEITVWVNQLSSLKKNLAELEEKILINTSEYENTEADIERTEQRMQELTHDMQDSQIKIDELRQKIRETEQADSRINAEIAVCENEIKHCRENIEEYKKRRENAENADSETAAEIDRKLSEKKNKEEMLSNTVREYSLREKELNETAAKQESFDKEYESENAVLNKLYITRSKYAASIETGKSGRNDMLRQLDIAADQLKALNDALENYQKEKTEVISGGSLLDEKISEEQNRLSGISKLYETKSEKFRTAEKELNDLSFKIRGIDQKLGFLTGLENSMEGFNNAVKQILRSSNRGALRGIHGTVSQLISAPSKYSAAIETALGGALQNIVTENEECAKEAIRFLKDNRAGRATFLPITSVKGNRLNERLDGQDGFIALGCDLVKYDERYEGIIGSLLGRIAVCEDLDSAGDIAKRFGYKFRIVTLDGQIINAGGSFTGGSLAKSAGMLSRKSEIDSLTEEKKNLSADLAQAKTNRDRLKAETDKLNFDIEASKDKIRQTENDRIRFDSEIKRIESGIVQTERQLESSADQTEVIRKRIKQLEAEEISSTARLEEISREISERESAAAASSEKKSEISARRTEISEALSKLKITEAELAKEIEGIDETIRRIEEQRRSNGDDSARMAVLIDEQKRIIEDKQLEIKSLLDRLSSSKDIIEKLNSGISDERSVSVEKEAETTQLRRKSRELSDSKEKFAAERTRLEERRSSVRSSCDEIIHSMEEQYELYLSEAEKLARPVDNINQTQRELAVIKQKIRALGNVNVAAIEEYKEVSEQYEFMSGQVNDVISSKKKLEDIIAELTETMKKQFSESFELINENFRKIFAELFGGGKAELNLTDPENVLESGIEINVAPPGKVIKSLSLLSGGEQAFVAIALYFAILNIKPAPFCILDEIEAALDDVNVTRYAKYLRHYTDSTQFITITHRRGTMEEADILYGVTMQQKGCSKLIKLEQPPKEDVI